MTGDSRASSPVVGIDLDGTLIDTWRRQELLLNSVMTNFGIQDHLSNFVQMKRQGLSTEQVLSKFGFSSAISRRIAGAWKEEVESAEWLREDLLFEDTVPFLETWNVDFILCSARSNREGLHQQLQALGIEHLLASISCVAPGHLVSKRKAVVWQRANVAIVIGDTEIDAQAAHEIGVPAYLLYRGARSQSFLRTRGWHSHERLPRTFEMSCLIRAGNR